MARTPRPRREPTIPLAPPALDATGEALREIVTDVFGAVTGAEIGVAVDEVTLTVSVESVPVVCDTCKHDDRLRFDYLRCLSIVDYIDSTGDLELNYHIYSLTNRYKMVVKTRLPEDAPIAPTVTGIWAGANWYERESHDLFGVTFEGHPDLSPLLLYDGFEGFPGRKSFPFHDYDEW